MHAAQHTCVRARACARPLLCARQPPPLQAVPGKRPHGLSLTATARCMITPSLPYSFAPNACGARVLGQARRGVYDGAAPRLTIPSSSYHHTGTGRRRHHHRPAPPPPPPTEPASVSMPVESPSATDSPVTLYRELASTYADSSRAPMPPAVFVQPQATIVLACPWRGMTHMNTRTHTHACAHTHTHTHQRTPWI